MPKNQDQTIQITLTPRTASAVLTALSVTVDKVVEDFAKDAKNAPAFIREIFMRSRSEGLLNPLQEVGEAIRKASNETWADDATKADADQRENGLVYDKKLATFDDEGALIDDAPDYDADADPNEA